MLEDFKTSIPTDFLSGWIATNTIQRILYAKFFDVNPSIDLEDELIQWLLKLKILVSEHAQLQFLCDVADIRQAVFRQDRQLAHQLMQEFETNYDEKVVETMTGEVDFYISSENYNRLYDKVKETSIWTKWMVKELMASTLRLLTK